MKHLLIALIASLLCVISYAQGPAAKSNLIDVKSLRTKSVETDTIYTKSFKNTTTAALPDDVDKRYITDAQKSSLNGVTGNIQDQVDNKQDVINGSGILKGTGSGAVAPATPNVDYVTPTGVDARVNTTLNTLPKTLLDTVILGKNFLFSPNDSTFRNRALLDGVQYLVNANTDSTLFLSFLTDAVPTSASNYFMTSGAIYTALALKATLAATSNTFTGKLGIGALDNSFYLTVSSPLTSSAKFSSTHVNGGNIRLERAGGTPSAADVLISQILFGVSTETNSDAFISVYSAEAHTANSIQGTSIRMGTTRLGAVSTSEAFRITANGKWSNTGTDPDPSSMIDLSNSGISGTRGGILIPKVSSSQKSAMSSIAADGLLVYQSDGIKGIYIYDTLTANKGWHLLGSGSSSGSTSGGYALYASLSSTSLSSTTSTYIGSIASATGAGTSKIPIPVSGIITSIQMVIQVAGTVSSAETGAFYFMINGGPQNLIVQGVSTSTSGTTSTIYGNLALSTPVFAGDYMEIKFLPPGLTGSGSATAWTTSPTSVRMSGTIFIQ